MKTKEKIPNKLSQNFTLPLPLGWGVKKFPYTTPSISISNKYLYSNLYLSNSSSLYTIHYFTESNTPLNPEGERFTEDFAEDFLSRHPLIFKNQYSRYIPNKAKRALERYCPVKLLKNIHPDKKVAVELCLVFLSSLANAYYITDEGTYKELYSKILQRQVSSSNDNLYTKIIKLLEIGTKDKGPIIKVRNYFSVGGFSKGYMLTDNYRDKGVKNYKFKTEHVRNLVSKNYYRTLAEALSNPIASNLINFYQSVDLPTMEEIKKEAKRLVKEGYKTKKGKKLTFLNRHPKSYWKDSESRSFVEEDIELYKRLTQEGFMVPTISEENAGGRVTDSFNLMPSWIRNLIKINGKQIVEADYTALHPNIAMKVYGGKAKFITHEKVSSELNMDVKKVKVQHLSFFNHEWDDMFKSPLFNYYKKDLTLMEGLFKDKQVDHKLTTVKMFSVEVEIMTNVIKRLNEGGIYVMYVYDALYTCDENIERVKQIMNEEIIKVGVYTECK